MSAVLVLPGCASCLHMRSDGLTCDAFPNGIPPLIAQGDFDHTKPFAGDGGIQWATGEQSLLDGDGHVPAHTVEPSYIGDGWDGKATVRVKPYERGGRQVTGYTRSQALREVDDAVEKIASIRSKDPYDKTIDDMIEAGAAVHSVLLKDRGPARARKKVDRALVELEHEESRRDKVQTLMNDQIEGQEEIRRQNPGLPHDDLLKLYYDQGVGDRQVNQQVTDLLSPEELTRDEFWFRAEMPSSDTPKTSELQVHKVMGYLNLRSDNARWDYKKAQEYAGVRHVAAMARTLKRVRDGYGAGKLNFIDPDGHPLSEGYDKGVEEVLSAAAQMLPVEWVTAANERGEVIPIAVDRDEATGYTGRAYHELITSSHGPAYEAIPSLARVHDDSRIHTSPDNLPVAVHELTHRVQATNSVVSRLEREYHEHRVGDQEPVELYGGNDLGFGVERSKPDEFMDPYMGKVYESQIPLGGMGYTGMETVQLVSQVPKELLTMGVQEVWFPNIHGAGDIFEADPEMANFVLGVLASA